jgi:TolA-binding protein
MGRWVITIVGIALAAAAGYVAGRLRSSAQSAQTRQVETRLEESKSDLAILRGEKQELQQRLEQLSKEQERLAQENEILRKQQVTEQLKTGQPGELPSLPPK